MTENMSGCGIFQSKCLTHRVGHQNNVANEMHSLNQMIIVIILN